MKIQIVFLFSILLFSCKKETKFDESFYALRGKWVGVNELKHHSVTISKKFYNITFEIERNIKRRINNVKLDEPLLIGDKYWNRMNLNSRNASLSVFYNEQSDTIMVASISVVVNSETTPIHQKYVRR